MLCGFSDAKLQIPDKCPSSTPYIHTMTDFNRFVAPEGQGNPDDASVAQAAACLDRFTAAFNACDLAGMDGALHFPHVMLSGAVRLVWPAAGQHPADFFEKLKASGWHCTQYEAQEPVLVSQDKVHFVVAYTRRAADDSVLSFHKNLWILTRVQGQWGIALRSY